MIKGMIRHRPDQIRIYPIFGRVLTFIFGWDAKRHPHDKAGTGGSGYACPVPSIASVEAGQLEVGGTGPLVFQRLAAPLFETAQHPGKQMNQNDWRNSLLRGNAIPTRRKTA
jgi:hypothetical protein